MALVFKGIVTGLSVLLRISEWDYKMKKIPNKK
jgi:hypothetical protein